MTDNYQSLDAFGLALAKKRKEAIDARRQSGVDEEWREDEDAYDGVDDIGRNEDPWRSKPPGKLAPQNLQAVRSTVLPNITRPYCYSASARLSDMLLPADEVPWKLQPTPIPELQRAVESRSQLLDQSGEPIVSPGGVQLTEGMLAQQMLDIADERAKNAQKRIEDWTTESRWCDEARRVIEDAAKIGTGILKGPVPVARRRQRWIVTEGAGSIQIQTDLVPASRRISYWDFFPDPACGENIHDGAYVWERDRLTPKKLLDLLSQPGYLREQIALCLKEGPQDPEYTEGHDAPPLMTGDTKERRFEVWYYTGYASREDIEAAGCQCDSENAQVPVLVTMVNNHVIRASLNPLDTGAYPYDVFIWQPRPGYWFGRGVARQIRTPQRILTAATRAMMDNAALASGPILAVMQSVLVPEDGDWTLRPRKVFTAAEDASATDVRQAITVFDIPIHTERMMQIIQFALRIAEDTTGMPMILQGQMGQKAPDTVGGMTILQNNATALPRQLARQFDALITKPHIGRYYAWLMQHGEDQQEKGDMEIITKASSSLVERDMQNQHLPAVMQASLNPQYQLSPALAAEEWLRSLRFDPRRLKLSEKEQAEAAKMPPSPPPQVMQAQIGAEVEQAKIQNEAQQNQSDRELAVLLKRLDMEIAQLDNASELQREAMRLRAMIESRSNEVAVQQR